MQSHNLFFGKSYVFEEDAKLTSKNKTQQDLLLKILSRSNHKIEPSSIVDILGNENLDQYKIESKNGLLYTLKISLDEDCEVLKSESEFLKNNKSVFIPNYYDSNTIKIGMPIVYLLSSYENGFNIDDLGVAYILKNNESFFYTLNHFSNLKTERSFDEYCDLIFCSFSTKNSSDFLKSNISNFHNFDVINDIFKTLEQSARSCDIDFSDTNQICHGLLTKDDIVSRNSLFKLKNFGYCFVGDPIFDLCFLSLSCGYNEHKSALLFKKYCEFVEIDFLENLNKYNSIFNCACCIFFSKMLFEFLIEECIFSTSRPNKLLESSMKLSSTFNFLKRTSIPEQQKKLIQKIITRPIIEKT